MSLDNSCMLVSLNIRSWTAEAKDRKVSKQVADQHNVADNVGKYTKKLLDNEAIQAIQKIASAARADHYFSTLPWSSEGARILPASLFDEYANKMRDHKRAYREQVDAFVTDYKAMIEEAKHRLNGLFNENDYPPADKIRERFDFSIRVNPVPNANDFRVELAQPDVEKIKAEITKDAELATRTAMDAAWHRLRDVVENMSERLGSYTGTKSGSFRDTLVENVRDLVGILPKLNITGDPNLTRMTKEVREKLCRYDAAALREDEAVRTTVADEAAEIFAKLKSFGG